MFNNDYLSNNNRGNNDNNFIHSTIPLSSIPQMQIPMCLTNKGRKEELSASIHFLILIS